MTEKRLKHKVGDQCKYEKALDKTRKHPDVPSS